MIDFPNSPAVDQIFTASTGAIYKWNGTLWVTVGNTAAIYTGTTPPANPWVSQLWYNTEHARLYIYYDDGNTTQWVPSAPIPATSTPPTPTYPGSDPGCKTTVLGAQFNLTGAYQSIVDTGLIGLAGQKWRISAYLTVNMTVAQWAYYDINDGTPRATGQIYVGVNTAVADASREFITPLVAPSTFALRAYAGSTGFIPSGMAAITAERLS